MIRVPRVVIVVRLVAVVVGLALAAVGAAMDDRRIVGGAIVALGVSVVLGFLLRAQARRSAAPEPEPSPERDPAPPES